MSQGKFIGNVNLLDLRKATPESVAMIRGVGNVNLVLTTTETTRLLSTLSIGNLNTSIEVPADVKIDMITGHTAYKAESFAHLESPVFALVLGHCTIEPDVTAEMILNGFSGIIVAGRLALPETLAGAVQSRLRQTLGKVKTYPALKTVFSADVELNERWLRGLEDGAEVCILGGLAAPQVASNELIERKIKRLFVMEGIDCHEENAEALEARLVVGSGKLKAIPAGFVVVEKPLHLDADLLDALPARKLLCKETVQIDAGVPAALLDERLDALWAEELILCPAGLKSVLVKKCDLFKNQVVFYEGHLWLVKGESALSASYLDSIEGKLTLVVTGELTIDPALDARTLAERLAKVHNLGEIRCTPEQMGAIQARLGLQDGELVDSSRKEEPKEEDSDFIGNANYLAL
jgi:hypothetical protein